MSLVKCIVVILSAAAAVNGLATGHHSGRSIHHRAALAARAPAAAVPIVGEAVPVVKRAPRTTGRRRCRNRLSDLESSSAVPAQTSPVVPGVINAAPLPNQRTTTQQQQAPAPTQQPPQPPQAPAPPPPQQPPQQGGNSGGGTGANTGEGTFYDTGLGACGITNVDTDFIVAVSHSLFDSFPGYNGLNPNNNPICNRRIRAYFEGKSVEVTVTDRCGGCAHNDLDFSPSAFARLADFGRGRIHGMTWDWI